MYHSMFASGCKKGRKEEKKEVSCLAAVTRKESKESK